MKIAPSLLAADFSRLADEIKDIEKGGADLLHLDVMDGHFVPNLSFGIPILQSIRPVTQLPFDVHLMTENPECYIEELAKLPVSMISFHAEAVIHLDRVIQMIRGKGIKAGIALNPGTPIRVLDEILPLLDFVLIMSVNPGFGGQKFIPYCQDKVSRLKEEIIRRNLSVKIEVDGGVNRKNAELLKKAGADILVAGSSVFGQDDRKTAIDALRFC